MIYAHMKSRKNLPRIGKKDNDFNTVQKKNLHYPKKSDKYRNHQEISYKRMKNISIHIKYI